MAYECDFQVLEARVVASVRRRVTWQEIGQVILPMYGEVYALLNAQGITGRGQNVALYHDAGPEGAELEVGVQVAESFTPTGVVARSETPGGLAGHTVHWGEYHLLGQAHEAVIAWLQAQGKAPGVGLEVYGDWHEDAAQRRTDVYRVF